MNKTIQLRNGNVLTITEKDKPVAAALIMLRINRAVTWEFLNRMLYFARLMGVRELCQDAYNTRAECMNTGVWVRDGAMLTVTDGKVDSMPWKKALDLETEGWQAQL